MKWRTWSAESPETIGPILDAAAHDRALEEIHAHGQQSPADPATCCRIDLLIEAAHAFAEISLTHARGVTANSASAQIGLKAENDRLRQEIVLLREETRIKDARMEQLPPQRRPHYPPIERLAILELRANRYAARSGARSTLLSFAAPSPFRTRFKAVSEMWAGAVISIPIGLPLREKSTNMPGPLRSVRWLLSPARRGKYR